MYADPGEAGFLFIIRSKVLKFAGDIQSPLKNEPDVFLLLLALCCCINFLSFRKLKFNCHFSALKVQRYPLLRFAPSWQFIFEVGFSLFYFPTGEWI